MARVDPLTSKLGSNQGIWTEPGKGSKSAMTECEQKKAS